MEPEYVQVIQGTKQLRGLVVVTTPTTYTVQTSDGLFTVNRDGTRRRGGSYQLHNPTPEEIAEAQRVQAEQERVRLARQRAARVADALRNLAAMNTRPAEDWSAAEEQRFAEAVSTIRDVLRG